MREQLPGFVARERLRQASLQTAQGAGYQLSIDGVGQIGMACEYLAAEKGRILPELPGRRARFRRFCACGTGEWQDKPKTGGSEAERALQRHGIPRRGTAGL